MQNEKQLFTTTRNANNIARVKATVKRQLKCECRSRKHLECQQARMRKDQQAVQDIHSCMEDLDVDSFESFSPKVQYLQSVQVAS